MATMPPFPEMPGVVVLVLQGVGFKYQDHTVVVELAHNDTIQGAEQTPRCAAPLPTCMHCLALPELNDSSALCYSLHSMMW